MLQQKSIVIDLQERTCVSANNPSLPTGELIVVCALAPLIKTLQLELLNSMTPAPLKATLRARSASARQRSAR